MTLIAANYLGGSVATIPILPDGGLGQRVSLVHTSGSGPNARQAGPHARGVVVDPSGRFVLVADLGADRVFVFPFDRQTHQMRDNAVRAVVFPAGSGPRHLLFCPNGRTVYVVSELSAEITAFSWAPVTGQLKAMHHSGRRLLVSDGKEGRISVFAVAPRTGMPTTTDHGLATPKPATLAFGE